MIILDLGLAGANACAVRSALRHHPRPHGVPVVLVGQPGDDDDTLLASLTLDRLLAQLYRQLP